MCELLLACCWGCDGARELVAFAASGMSKGFGRSRPSAVARGVSWSSTDGHNLIIALESENEDGGVVLGASAGCRRRALASDIFGCGAAGEIIGIIAPPSSAIRCQLDETVSLAMHIGAPAVIRTGART